jgi:hypothetical protein
MTLNMYHGGLLVWDTEKPEELVVAPTSEHSHSEPITKVCSKQKSPIFQNGTISKNTTKYKALVV